MALATGGIVLRAVVALLLVAIAAAGAAYLLRRPRTAAADARMGVWQHVEELRNRLAIAVVSWLVAFVAAFTFRIEVRGGWPVPVPALQDNLASQTFQVIAGHLVPDGVRLVVTRPLDAFLAELSIAAGIGFVVALPVIAWQVAAFGGPALRPEERRAARVAVVPSLVLFLAGAAFAWYLVLPLLLEVLYGYAGPIGAEPLLVVGDLVSFALTFILTFGLAFQLPVVMYGLARVGLVSARGFASKWRHAVVGILVFSALLTDPTVLSQVMMAVPMMLLYGVGIVAARRASRVRSAAA